MDALYIEELNRRVSMIESTHQLVQQLTPLTQESGAFIDIARSALREAAKLDRAEFKKVAKGEV